MSIYNHMNDPEEHRSTCESCEKDFTWSEHGPFYQGHNEREFINCPYCGEKNGSIRTSGFVFTSKID